MKIIQKSRKRATVAALLLIFPAAISIFYILQNRAMGETKAAPPMQGMEGMKRGINETGQATTMLTSQKKQRIGVKVAEVREKSVEKIIRAAGRVAYDERRLAQINLRVEGWIQDLFINFTGQEVKKEGRSLPSTRPIFFPRSKSTCWPKGAKRS